MTKVKSITLTPEEIRSVKVFCQNSMVMEPSIANLVKSILKKLSGKESETIRIFIEEKPKNKKRGRPPKVRKTEKTIKVLPATEPESSKPTPEPITSTEEKNADKIIIKKRGRPRRIPIELPKMVLSTTEFELENIETTQETTVLIEEQVVETHIMEEMGNQQEESNSETQIEIPVPESEQIETPSATIATASRQEVEPKLLVASVNSEPEQKESDQPTNSEQNNPRFNLLQKFLKKLRPKNRP